MAKCLLTKYNSINNPQGTSLLFAWLTHLSLYLIGILL